MTIGEIEALAFCIVYTVCIGILGALHTPQITRWLKWRARRPDPFAYKDNWDGFKRALQEWQAWKP